MDRAKILLVEDDVSIAGLITACLEGEGFSVHRVEGGWEGLARSLTDAFDLIILDVMLPGIDGYEICRRVRSTQPDMPIMFLTARADEDDQIQGWKLGADDYVTKPFSTRVLGLRVRALLQRKWAGKGPSEMIRVAHVEIDTAACRVSAGGKTIELTAREFELLLFFVQNPNQVFTRKQIYEQVWGEPYLRDENTVAVFIHRLREKLEHDPAAPTLITTVRGLGYSFAGR